MQKITTCLWFNGKVQEAIDFYTSIFKNSKILDITYYGETHPQLAGEILVARFELDGQGLMILNGGPGFPFTELSAICISSVGPLQRCQACDQHYQGSV